MLIWPQLSRSNNQGGARFAGLWATTRGGLFIQAADNNQQNGRRRDKFRLISHTIEWGLYFTLTQLSSLYFTPPLGPLRVQTIEHAPLELSAILVDNFRARPEFSIQLFTRFVVQINQRTRCGCGGRQLYVLASRKHRVSAEETVCKHQ